MVHTLTVLTLRLAEAIGLYWLAAGVGLLLAPNRLRALIDDMERSPALVFLMGLVAFAIGTAMLMAHHVLYDPLSVIVTVVAAIAAIEGLALIAFPQPLLALARPFAASAPLWGMVSIVLGFLLFLAGFTGRADVLP